MAWEGGKKRKSSGDLETITGLFEKQSKSGNTYYSAWLKKGLEIEGLVTIAPGANIMMFEVAQEDDRDPTFRLCISPPVRRDSGWKSENRPDDDGEEKSESKESPELNIKWKPRSKNTSPAPDSGIGETDDDDGIPF